MPQIVNRPVSVGDATLSGRTDELKTHGRVSQISQATIERSREVIQLVESRFPDHPGSLDHFQMPVTRQQAKVFLKKFIDNILPSFGLWEDAMWTDEAFLCHSRLSAPLNMKLLNPRECVDAAVEAYRAGKALLNSFEGFVRQILGWREFIRGVYWLKMPEYIEMNYFDHQLELPSFFWDGETEMNCVRQSMQHVMDHGYSHHIQRLMVLGNFAQLWGAHPRLFHEPQEIADIRTRAEELRRDWGSSAQSR